MTEQEKPLPAIDIHGDFPCVVNRSASGQLQLSIDLRNCQERQTFRNNLHQHAKLLFDGEAHGPVTTNVEMGRFKRLEYVLPATPKDGQKITLKLLQEPILELVYDAKTQRWNGTEEAPILQLAPSEVRAFGMQLRSDVLSQFPYSREARRGFDYDKHAPITDLHTHLSAQIDSEQLFDIALKADLQGDTPITYPVELLELIQSGITKPQKDEQKIIKVKATPFNPLKHEGLKCEQDSGECSAIRIKDLTPDQRRAIINSMRVMPDNCTLPTRFDRELYRFRNPLVKNPKLAAAMVHAVAQDYARKGVEYAALSTSAMLDPYWFEAMEAAVDEIERAGGVEVDGKLRPMHMRFLIGVPRNVSPEETMVVLNKIKFLARHPYIVGMDMNGYESNKTSHFFWALAHMGRWARDSHANPEEAPWKFQEKFIMQVHAGETSKNLGNVGHAIELSQHYKVRVMVGHVLNAVLTQPQQEWLRRLGDATKRETDRLIFQMCPDSNQAFRAKPLVHHSPLLRRVEQAQCVFGTDGGGMLGISPRALAYSAIAAGASLGHLKEIRHYERGFIDRQLTREVENRQTFERAYGKEKEGSQAFIKAYKQFCLQYPHPAREREKFTKFLPKEFSGKKPLFIGGAAGTSWGMLDKLDQWEIEQFMDFLVETVDPSKAYFVLGRVQNDGVSKALDIAINRHNSKYPANPFLVLARVAGKPTGEFPETVSWIQPIDKEPDRAAEDMTQFLIAHKGKALLFPGQDYTAEMIVGAHDERMPVDCAFMVPRVGKGDDQGKIFELAETMPDAAQFKSNHEIAVTRIGKENAAIDAFIDRVLQPGSPLIRDEEDRDSMLRSGADLHRIKDDVLAHWHRKHETKIKEYVTISKLSVLGGRVAI